MRTALYFPHTEIRSKSLLRTALLTWDRLEFIAPYRGYRSTYRDREMARAMEIIGRARVPTAHEQMRVHGAIQELLEGPIPETFYYHGSEDTRPYLTGSEDVRPPYNIFPQKLAEKSWELLREKGLTADYLRYGGGLSRQDFPMSEPAGLTLMSVLADVLAGDTRARVTDRGLAYATIANITTPVREGPEQASELERIVGIMAQTVEARNLFDPYLSGAGDR